MAKINLFKIETYRKSKPPNAVLFLHGFPGYTTRNVDIAEAVSIRCKCDVYVLNFEGLDDSPKLFSFKNSVTNVGQAIEYLLTQYEQLNVVAHSFGAYALFSAPETASTRFDKIILMSPLVELPELEIAKSIVADFVSEEAATRKKKYKAEELLDELETLRKSKFVQQIPKLIKTAKIQIDIIQANNDDVTPVAMFNEWLLRNGLEKKLRIDFVDDDHWFSDRSRIIEMIVERLIEVSKD